VDREKSPTSRYNYICCAHIFWFSLWASLMNKMNKCQLRIFAEELKFTRNSAGALLKHPNYSYCLVNAISLIKHSILLLRITLWAPPLSKLVRVFRFCWGGGDFHYKKELFRSIFSFQDKQRKTVITGYSVNSEQQRKFSNAITRHSFSCPRYVSLLY